MHRRMRKRQRHRSAGPKFTLLTLLTLGATGCADRVHPPVPPPSPPPAASPSSRPVPFVATAYCTGRITAGGAVVREGMVAADPMVLPLRTVIHISGLGR